MVEYGEKVENENENENEEILIRMEKKKDGSYTVKEFENSSSEFDLDRMIFEFVKSKNGGISSDMQNYEVVQWTETELL